MSFTIDAHMDVPWLQTKLTRQGLDSFTLGLGHSTSMFTKDKAKAGGLDAAIFALYLSDCMQDQMTKTQVNDAIDKQYNRILFDMAANLATDTRHEFNVRMGRMPIFVGLEGGRLLNKSYGRFIDLVEKGIVYLGLCHNRNSPLGGSATDSDTGLTAFGKDIVRACEEYKVLVDLSHSSDKTASNVLYLANRPVLASHSGARALVNHPRNLSDDLIKAIAATGGVICVPYAKRFVGYPNVRIADHINHIADIAGVDHVGIGSDLDGAKLIDGFNSVDQWSNAVVPDLVAAGVSQIDIKKILGGNLERILRHV